ncbi:MAG: helicase-related protein, partial [Betaproteobacteria bacterium]
VFNFDVPFNAEDYVHRIGRTGRAGASGIAVTLVTRDDTRLTGEIEKLIKKKIDLQAFELEDDRPRRPRYEREGEGRERDRDGGRDHGRDAERSHRAAPRPPQRSNDPFFDRPYEPPAADQKPAWETEAPAKPTSGVSRNIKPRRKVATLLGGVVTPAD